MSEYAVSAPSALLAQFKVVHPRAALPAAGVGFALAVWSVPKSTRDQPVVASYEMA